MWPRLWLLGFFGEMLRSVGQDSFDEELVVLVLRLGRRRLALLLELLVLDHRVNLSSGHRVKVHHVLFAVARLREDLRAQQALEWLQPRVFTEMILKVACFGELFAAGVDTAGVVDSKALRVLVAHVFNRDPVCWNAFKTLFDRPLGFIWFIHLIFKEGWTGGLSCLGTGFCGVVELARAVS